MQLNSLFSALSHCPETMILLYPGSLPAPPPDCGQLQGRWAVQIPMEQVSAPIRGLDTAPCPCEGVLPGEDRQEATHTVTHRSTEGCTRHNAEQRRDWRLGDVAGRSLTQCGQVSPWGRSEVKRLEQGGEVRGNRQATGGEGRSCEPSGPCGVYLNVLCDALGPQDESRSGGQRGSQRTSAPAGETALAGGPRGVRGEILDTF